jgi:hypothetical protein
MPSEPDNGGQESQAPEESLDSYFRESRRLWLGILVILPLVVLYQVGIVQSGSTTRNLAEVWISSYLSRFGVEVATAVNVLLIAALVYGLWEMRRGGALSVGFMAVMVVEASLYALMLFSTISLVARSLDRAVQEVLVFGIPNKTLLLSLGAGVYEELLFRLVLLGGGILLLRKVFMWNTMLSAVVMLAVSSLLFAGVHHLGGGEPLESYVFIFRTLCGAVLGAIFLARGLGIAVWTHALYNALVLVAGASA